IKEEEMKYVVLVGDGMADYPLKELDNRTPLQVANTENLDFLATHGMIGQVKTIPEGMPKGSDVAILSVLGYDPCKCYTGRGPLEAHALGINLAEDEIAFRCNLVTVKDGVLVDYSAGHISTDEAKILIKDLDNKVQGLRSAVHGLRFYPGVSYRHIFTINGDFEEVSCTPPHDITGKEFKGYLPNGMGSEILREIMDNSIKLLDRHEINQKREWEGKNPANMVWLWGQGKAPRLETFKQKFALDGAAISAVDLIKGIASFAGLDSISVPGTTGFYDTDYLAKARYALETIDRKDLVFVHVEAPDEAGHIGDIELKIKTIEDFDKKVVGTILNNISGDYRVLAMSDHHTPIGVRTHTSDPVPFVIYGLGVKPDSAKSFDEPQAKGSSTYLSEGHKLMDLFIKGKY
ncbi:MAG: cofactor-independent phosphoglycerate mutase, partial [bacterium]|nr:cofactor-independent phosphoglycerate mutase [bacterium]